jgi:PadR family transcriptional regulator PadR
MIQSLVSPDDIESRLMFREFFLGFVKIHILYHAAEAPVYGLELIQELARHGYDLSPGTIYPTLHSLEKAGYLQGERLPVGGKIRKYYRITPAGREALAAIKPKIRELVEEVLEGHGPDERVSTGPATGAEIEGMR